jgi:hypothetical protein
MGNMKTEYVELNGNNPLHILSPVKLLSECYLSVGGIGTVFMTEFKF